MLINKIVKMKKLKSKRSQVWIETVIYTLIGLTVIGLVLTFATPKIEAARDKAVLDQTVNALSLIDGKIAEIQMAVGNTRAVSFTLQKGTLTFDCDNDRIAYLLSGSKYAYSQAGQNVSIMDMSVGSLNARTDSGANMDVNLWIDYKGKINMTCKGDGGKITMPQASTAYKIILNNKDLVDGLNVIDLTVS